MIPNDPQKPFASSRRDSDPAVGRTRRRSRPWSDKFAEAFRGIKLGVRGHSSFFVHFFFAAMAVAFAIALECSAVEWCLIVLCIGGVLTTELVNSAIETLFHGLDDETKSHWNGCMEVAAGAVLVAGVTAAVVGSIVFVGRLWSIFHPG